MALEALEENHEEIVHNWALFEKNKNAIHAIKEALAQPEQETNKNGSPCPEFWDWLPKAYNFEGDGNFTKYSMEVAFLAGKQASQPEQEPVAWMFQHDETGRMNYVSNDGIHDPTMFLGMNPQYALVCPLYTTPPQRKPLSDEEMKKIWYAMQNIMGWYSFEEVARAIEVAHDIKE